MYKRQTYNRDGTKLFITRLAPEFEPSQISQKPSNNYTSKQIEVIEINGKHIKLLDANSDHLMLFDYSDTGKLFSSFHDNEEIIVWNTDYKLMDKIAPPPSNIRGTEEQNPVSYTHLDVYKRQERPSGRHSATVPMPST